MVILNVFPHAQQPQYSNVVTGLPEVPEPQEAPLFVSRGA